MKGCKRPRWFGAVSVVALLATIVVPAGPAGADGTADQITGTGTTNSAVTVDWSSGLLGKDNKPLPQQRDPHSLLSFMYPDFKDLKVSVSQTRDLVHQAVSVGWSGLPSNGTTGGFLQIMQCYGDSTAGPDPTGCEFGTASSQLSGGLGGNVQAGTRSGSMCAAPAVPSVTNPPDTLDHAGVFAGCDPAEPSDKSHVDPGSTSASTYTVPFVPAGTTNKHYNLDLPQDFSALSTNEVKDAASGPDGTGQNFFQVLTSVEAPGLQCGQTEADGSTRNCWLVIVPRGTYDANGYQISGINPIRGYLASSPLGQSTWAQRIQIHLDFAPIGVDCPINTTKERQTIGTQLVSAALSSWNFTLNTQSDCTAILAFAPTPEATNTRELSDPTSGDDLAFTTIPIGAEADRLGPSDHGAIPPLVYAPVTASAITFGFNVNLNSTNGFDPNPVKLTPRLLAKALTQSYRLDLPDFFSAGNAPGPDWALSNPLSIVQDPEFMKLNNNPRIDFGGVSASLAPLLTEDHSAVVQQVWRWILSDPGARAWLGGKPDENGMVINPNYQVLGLADAPIDHFPRADPTTYNTGGLGETTGRDSFLLLPYVESFEAGAAKVRAANNPEGQNWDPSLSPPSGNGIGWWGKGTLEAPGQTFMSAVTDTPNLAAYGLVPAALCDGSGANCVTPSAASIGAAVANGKPDSAGLVQVDPAGAGVNAYPLVNVIYAAVNTTAAPDALNAFASLFDYAAGPGQVAGVAPGQLPHGYLPLPDNLRAQAKAAADKLRADAVAKPATNGPGDTNSGSGAQQQQLADAGASAGGGSGGAGDAGTPANSAAPGTPPAAPTPASVAPQHKPSPVLAAKATPRDPAGAMEWILLGIVIAGAVGGFGGALLRAKLPALAKLPSWLRR